MLFSLACCATISLCLSLLRSKGESGNDMRTVQQTGYNEEQKGLD